MLYSFGGLANQNSQRVYGDLQQPQVQKQIRVRRIFTFLSSTFKKEERLFRLTAKDSPRKPL